MLKDLQSWHEHGVLGPLMKAYSKANKIKYVRALWIHSWKKTPERRKAKSRLVVDGNKDYCDLSLPPTRAPGCKARPELLTYTC